MKRHLLALACIAAVPAAAHDAAAQPAKVDPQKAKTAKQYVDAGLAAQNAKDFDTAISLYTKAFELVPHPVLLFNIGQAHRLAGNSGEAVRFYQRYLDADPKGPQAKTARDLIAEINARAAAEVKQREDAHKAEEARKAEAARKAEEARKAEAARKAEEARVAAAAAAPQPDDAQPEPEDSVPATSPGRSLRIAGIAASGVGVVALGVSVVFGLKARSISDELSEPGAVYDPSRISDGEAAERTAILLGVAGGALIASGAVMYILGRNQQSAAQEERITLQVRSDFVGLAFGGVLP